MQICITKVFKFGNAVVGYSIQFENGSYCSVFKDSLILFMEKSKYAPYNFSIKGDTVNVTGNVPIEHITEPSSLKNFYDLLDLAGVVMF